MRWNNKKKSEFISRHWDRQAVLALSRFCNQPKFAQFDTEITFGFDLFESSWAKHFRSKKKEWETKKHFSAPCLVTAVYQLCLYKYISYTYRRLSVSVLCVWDEMHTRFGQALGKPSEYILVNVFNGYERRISVSVRPNWGWALNT